MTPGDALLLLLALVGLICCVVATAVLVLALGSGRSRAGRDALGGMALGVTLMGIAVLLRG